MVSNSRADRVLQTLLRMVGKTPYLWGGDDANGLDCSGLIYFVLSPDYPSLVRLSAGQYTSSMSAANILKSLAAGTYIAISGGGGPGLSGLPLLPGVQCIPQVSLVTLGIDSAVWATMSAADQALFSGTTGDRWFHQMLRFQVSYRAVVPLNPKVQGSTRETVDRDLYIASSSYGNGVYKMPMRLEVDAVTKAWYYYDPPQSYLRAMTGVPSYLLEADGSVDLTKFWIDSYPLNL